jgi:hypothetical protein
LIANDDTAELKLNIYYDNVFKAVFTRNTPGSRGALSKLISAMTGRELLVIEVTVNDLPIDDLRDRPIRFDINCRVVDSGELINVEMTLSPSIYEVLRAEYYVSELHSSQSIKNDARGKGKDNAKKRKRLSYRDLKPTYQISFIVNNPAYAKKPLFNDAEFFHEFQYYDRERDITLGGRTRIIFIELSKLDAALKKDALQMTAKEHWAVYFKHNGDKDKEALINEILKEEEGIAMAQEEYLTITRDERERARLRSELKYILDKQSAEAEAEEFIEEAREQAEQERKRAESAEKKLVVERKQAEQVEKELVAERKQAKQERARTAQEREQAIAAMRTLGLSDKDIERIYQGK